MPPSARPFVATSLWAATTVRVMDDRTFYELEDEPLAAGQVDFLAALRQRLGHDLRPYCGEFSEDTLLLVLDVDAPDVALVSVGLLLRGDELQGDRISIHDRTFPPVPTRDAFVAKGSPGELADRGGALLKYFASRPVVRHEWLHRGKVYATCYLFEDSGERLAQMYRSDWAPRGQEARLVAEGFVHGKGWIQTRGLGDPQRVVRVRGSQ